MHPVTPREGMPGVSIPTVALIGNMANEDQHMFQIIPKCSKLKLERREEDQDFEYLCSADIAMVVYTHDII